MSRSVANFLYGVARSVTFLQPPKRQAMTLSRLMQRLRLTQGVGDLG